MTHRIKVADLPEFDAAKVLDSEAAVAARLRHSGSEQSGVVGDGLGRHRPCARHERDCQNLQARPG